LERYKQQRNLAGFDFDFGFAIIFAMRRLA
jgi:hypothetical protein